MIITRTGKYPYSVSGDQGDDNRATTTIPEILPTRVSICKHADVSAIFDNPKFAVMTASGYRIPAEEIDPIYRSCENPIRRTVSKPVVDVDSIVNYYLPPVQRGNFRIS